MFPKNIDRLAVFCFTGMLLFLGSSSVNSPAFAQSQPQQYGQQQQPSSEEQSGSRKQNSSSAPRQDNYYGTFNEGIVMETDPQTGTRIIQVSPPPKQEEQPDQNNTYIISPEIKIKPRQ